MVVVKLTDDQIKLFETGNKIETKEGKVYYNFPHWITKVKDNLYQLIESWELPTSKPRASAGLKNKYIISKSDGEKIDPNAFYFVLRLDTDFHARRAALAYARSVGKDNPELAKDLLNKVYLYDPSFKMSGKEWAEYYPYKILDPDGWDRTNFEESFHELISYDIFEKKVMQSTICPK